MAQGMLDSQIASSVMWGAERQMREIAEFHEAEAVGRSIAKQLLEVMASDSGTFGEATRGAGGRALFTELARSRGFIARVGSAYAKTVQDGREYGFFIWGTTSDSFRFGSEIAGPIPKPGEVATMGRVPNHLFNRYRLSDNTPNAFFHTHPNSYVLSGKDRIMSRMWYIPIISYGPSFGGGTSYDWSN